MKLLLSLIFMVILTLAMHWNSPAHVANNRFVFPFSQASSTSYTFTTIQNDTGGWFFNIKIGDKTFIIQKTIPSIQGNIAFADSAQATLVAQLMVDKLDAGIFPPSITIDELKYLKINY
jgi:hypothetical protein